LQFQRRKRWRGSLGQKKIFEGILAEILPNLTTNRNPQILED